MAFLKINNLSFRYDHQEKYALKGVDMDIAENTINVVIGPNGSGKTTLFQSILGLGVYEGNILLKGKPVGESSYQVGYLPQRFGFDPYIPITSRELLYLALSNCMHTKDEKRVMIIEALKKVGAERFANERIRDLSGGQLQRVLLARTIVHNPDLLLLDEPEAGVDPGGEKIFYQLIKDLVSTSEITALIASHEISLVREYADKVFCLNRTITCSGNPKKILTAKNLSKLYQEKVYELEHLH